MRFIYVTCILLHLGCGLNDASSSASVNVLSREILVDSLDGVYKEWYPGKQQIKYLGNLDQEGKRDRKSVV